MIGDEAAKARRLLELSHPLEEGIIKNWDDMELIWRYGFEEKVSDLYFHHVLVEYRY